MEYSTVKFTLTDGVALVTLNRPEALNALNTAFFRELNMVMDNLPEEAMVMVITGEGKAFAAGADIAEMVDKDPEQARGFSKYGQDTFNRLEVLEIPVIAAVNGYALGGGCELAMACDFRIASEKALFGQPEVNLGLIPGFAGTVRLPRYVGLGNALMLLLSGEAIKAPEALSMGLVSKVVAPESLMEEVMRLAKLICSKGPEAVRKVKVVARQAMRREYEKAMDIENEQFGSLFGPGSEGEEGMKAFLDKRKPQWN